MIFDKYKICLNVDGREPVWVFGKEHREKIIAWISEHFDDAVSGVPFSIFEGGSEYGYKIVSFDSETIYLQCLYQKKRCIQE